MTNYKNSREVFNLLNEQNIPYAILRNYDNIFEDEIYMDGHGDIDLLCEDSKQLAAALQAIPHPGHGPKGVGDFTHYILYINQQPVSIDARHFGDGYYCIEWQKKMIDRRVEHNGLYVLHPEDYFYSLIYHAIMQKEIFTQEYQVRLTKMGKELNIDCGGPNIQKWMQILETFMKKHNYQYVFPKDKHVLLNTRYIQDRKLLHINNLLWFKHFRYRLKIAGIEFLVTMKHRFFNKKLLKT